MNDTSPQATSLYLLQMLLQSAASDLSPLFLFGTSSHSASAALMGQPSGQRQVQGPPPRTMMRRDTGNLKRSTRIAGRACRQCSTTETAQWRKGPDGSTSYEIHLRPEAHCRHFLMHILSLSLFLIFTIYAVCAMPAANGTTDES